MSSGIEIQLVDTDITNDAQVVEVTTANPLANVQSGDGFVAEAIPTNFTISSGGMYGGYLGGNAPVWLSDLVDTLATDIIDENYQTQLDTFRTRLEGAEVGVAQFIDYVQNTDLSLAKLETDVKAELNGNISLVSSIAASKVDRDGAITVVNDLVGAKWLRENEGIADSYINSIAISIANDTFTSNLASTNLLSAVFDPETGITSLAAATSSLETKVGFVDNDGNTTGLLGDILALRNQVDGVVETFTSDFIPIDDTTRAPLNNVYPYGSVDTEDHPEYTGWYDTDVANGNTAVRDLHTGDTFIEYDLSDISQEMCEAAGGTWTPGIGEELGTCSITNAKVYKNSYRFARSTVDTDTDDDGYGWFAITDSTAADALAKALLAQDTADGKRTTFVDIPYKEVLIDDVYVKKYTQDVNPGDLWIIGSHRPYPNENETYQIREYRNGIAQNVTIDGVVYPKYYPDGELVRVIVDRDKNEDYNDSHWEIATRYRDDIDNVSDGLNTAVANITDLKSIQDGNVVLYYEDKALDDFDPETDIEDYGDVVTAATELDDAGSVNISDFVNVYVDKGQVFSAELNYGDYWIDIDADIEDSYYPVYMWDDIEWVRSYNAVAKNISDTYRAKLEAGDLASIVDGKMVVHYQDEAPTGLTIADIGDLWVDTDDLNITYIWDGNSWVDTNNRVSQDAYDVAQAATESLAIESAKIAGLEETNDGVVVTFYTSINENPTTMSYGDWLVYDKDAEYPTRVDRYQDTNGKNVGTLGWYNKSNDLYAKALIQAYDSKFIADGKTAVYYSAEDPSEDETISLDIGDMWVDVGSYNVTKVWGGSSLKWQETSNKVAEDAKALLNDLTIISGTDIRLDLTKAEVNSIPFTTFLKQELDAEVNIFSGDGSDFSTIAANINDIYIKTVATTNNNTGLTFNVVTTHKCTAVDPENVWTTVSNSDSLSKLADITDGKRTIYGGVYIPEGTAQSPLKDNDLWLPSGDVTINSEEQCSLVNGAWSDSKCSVTIIENDILRYDATSSKWKKSTRYDDIIDNLEDQLDNKIETYYSSISNNTVSLTGMVPTSTQNNRVGDYWYYTGIDEDTSVNSTHCVGEHLKKGKVYEFTSALVEGSNPVLYKYYWKETADVSRYAFDLADGKKAIYGGGVVPTISLFPDLSVSDLWIPSTDVAAIDTLIDTEEKCIAASGSWNGTSCIISDYYAEGEIHQYINDIWTKATRYSDDLATEVLRIEGLEEASDGLVTTFYGEYGTVPSSPSIGDLVLSSNNILLKYIGNGEWESVDYSYGDWFAVQSGLVISKVYRYQDATTKLKSDSMTWVDMSTTSYAKALIQAYNAEYVADGKVETFYSSTVPATASDGDMFVPTGNIEEVVPATDPVTYVYKPGEVWIWSDSSWTKMRSAGNVEDLDDYTSAVYDKNQALADQRDGKLNIYKSDTEPTAEDDDDIWIDTASKKVMLWDSSINEWVEPTNSDLLYEQYKDMDPSALRDGLLSVYYSLYTQPTIDPDTEATIEEYLDSVIVNDNVPTTIEGLTSKFGTVTNGTPNNSWSTTQKYNSIGDQWQIEYTETKTENEGTPEENAVDTDVVLVYRWSGASWTRVTDKYAYAIAESNKELIAKVNDDIEVRLSEEENVSAGAYLWTEGVTPKIGMRKVIDNDDYIYMGEILGWTKSTLLDSSDAQSTADTAKDWAGGASSILFNPTTGAVTGWNYADGGNGQSTFGIAADSFFIENSTIPGYKPFAVDGTNVVFNGKVSFTNVTGTPDVPITYSRDFNTLLIEYDNMPLWLLPAQLYIIEGSEAGDKYTITIEMLTGVNTLVVIEDSFGDEYMLVDQIGVGNSQSSEVILRESNVYVKRYGDVSSINFTATKIIPEGSTWKNTSTTPSILYTLVDGAWIENGTPGALTEADLGPTGTTTIDGGRIDTDSLFARDIVYTGTITGGTPQNGGGVIQSKNYVDSGGVEGMIIDLVNGSIYIA